MCIRNIKYVYEGNLTPKEPKFDMLWHLIDCAILLKDSDVWPATKFVLNGRGLYDTRRSVGRVLQYVDDTKDTRSIYL